MAMRIVIDARTVADHFPGIGRYVYNLLGGLGRLSHAHELVLLVSRGAPNSRYDLDALGLPLVEVPAPRSLSEHVRIPALLRGLRADLYHATYYLRPYVGLPCPAVTTLYDIIPRRFPEAASPQARLLFDLLHRLAIRSSRRLLAISQSACADLVEAYALPSDRIDVTPLAPDPHCTPQDAEVVAGLRARHGLPERYVLALASNKPHKNFVGLLRAWKLYCEGRAASPDRPGPPPTLVIAGHCDPRYREAEQLASELGLMGLVRFLPNVPEPELPALYTGAELFVFPSLYEGFGLPPLEAMACGAPVVCGVHSSLAEVAAGAAITADPSDPRSLAEAIGRVLGDAALRARMRTDGLAQAAKFSWERTAALTLAAYERAARG